jgi:hypothetical protein
MFLLAFSSFMSFYSASTFPPFFIYHFLLPHVLLLGLLPFLMHALENYYVFFSSSFPSVSPFIFLLLLSFSSLLLLHVILIYISFQLYLLLLLLLLEIILARLSASLLILR